MRYLQTLLVLLTGLYANGQLLHANWKKTVLHTDSNNIYLQGCAADKQGNIYTLSYIDKDAQQNNQKITHTEGPFFLTKLFRNGTITSTHSFGNNGFNDRCLMATDNDGNVIIGGSFSNEFYYDGVPVAYTKNISNHQEHHAFILKISPQGRLLWFKDFACDFFGIVTGFSFDRENNIYAAVYFTDSMSAPFYYRGSGSFGILSLKPSGAYRWHKTLCNTAYSGFIPMTMFRPRENCPEQFVLIVNTLDKMVLDKDTIYNEQPMQECEYLVELSTDGRNPHYKRLFRSGRSEGNAIATQGDKIFVGGIFYDSLEIDGGKDLRGDKFTAYTASYDEQLQPLDAKVVASNSYHFGIKELQYLPGSGLVLSLAFTDSFTVAGKQYTSNSYSYPSGAIHAIGTLVVGVNDKLEATGIGYVDGQNFNISDMVVYNKELTMAATHVSYNPITESSVYTGITLFRTEPFLEDNWPVTAAVKPLQYTVFPQPCSNSCTILFDSPVYGYAYNIYNTAGQLVDEIRATTYNDKAIIVDMATAPAGVYFLRMKNCCDQATIIKLVKL